MSVLSRPHALRRTPVVPEPRPAEHDDGVTAPARRWTAVPADRTSGRRRAAVVLVALVAAIAAGATIAVTQLTGGGGEPTQLAPRDELRGVTQLDRMRDEVLLRRHLSSDAQRASDAARDAARAAR